MKSSQGKNIFLIEKNKDSFSITDNDSTNKFSLSKLEKKLKEYVNSEWIIQKYIESIVPNDSRPFDIRVTVYRQEKHSWKVANPYVRVGKDGITSNLATGGSSVDAEIFLKEIYPNENLSLVSKLKEKALEVTVELQKNYDFRIDALGCDFGIENGELFLFEVNSYPGIKGNIKQAVKLKVNYYCNLLN